jgi:hypothetical protein
MSGRSEVEVVSDDADVVVFAAVSSMRGTASQHAT